MPQLITALEEKLAIKIKQLERQITEHAAYTRKKIEKKKREIFFTVFIIAALTGVVIFGAGWLAVALLGTALSIIVVESGLFLSLGLALNADLFYRVYIGIRDLSASEKIKIQNKDYDSLKKELVDIKKLFLLKTALSKKIGAQLDEVIQLSAIKHGSADFIQLGLKKQIEQLKQEKQNHPAYDRRLSDQENWSKLTRWSFISSTVGYFLSFILFGNLLIPLSLPIFPVISMINFILILVLIAPIAINSLLYTSYLLVRNALSAPKIKVENKEYAQLEKVIAKLDKLSQQQDKLDKGIKEKLQESDTSNAPAKGINAKISVEKLIAKDSGDKQSYGPLFTIPGNEESKMAAPSSDISYSDNLQAIR